MVYHLTMNKLFDKLYFERGWDHLSKFFTGFFNGCRDYLSLSPQLTWQDANS